MTTEVERATSWLVSAADPAVAALARRDLLGDPVAPTAAMASPIVQGLLTDLAEWTPRPYAKWRGAHWRLVSLVELGVPAGDPEVTAICQAVLGSWADPTRRGSRPCPWSRGGRAGAPHRRATLSRSRAGWGSRMIHA